MSDTTWIDQITDIYNELNDLDNKSLNHETFASKCANCCKYVEHDYHLKNNNNYSYINRKLTINDFTSSEIPNNLFGEDINYIICQRYLLSERYRRFYISRFSEYISDHYFIQISNTNEERNNYYDGKSDFTFLPCDSKYHDGMCYSLEDVIARMTLWNSIRRKKFIEANRRFLDNLDDKHVSVTDIKFQINMMDYLCEITNQDDTYHVGNYVFCQSNNDSKFYDPYRSVNPDVPYKELIYNLEVRDLLCSECINTLIKDKIIKETNDYFVLHKYPKVTVQYTICPLCDNVFQGLHNQYEDYCIAYHNSCDRYHNDCDASVTLERWDQDNYNDGIYLPYKSLYLSCGYGTHHDGNKLLFIRRPETEFLIKKQNLVKPYQEHTYQTNIDNDKSVRYYTYSEFLNTLEVNNVEYFTDLNELRKYCNAPHLSIDSTVCTPCLVTLLNVGVLVCIE